MEKVLTPFLRGKISLYQPKEGYRFNIDSVLLADFVKVSNQNASLIDLGTGSGIIPILLKLRYPNLKISALEVQPFFYTLAKENFQKNNLIVELTLGNVKDVKNLYQGQSFDYVVSNPPYIKGEYNQKNENLKIARSETLATLDDFVKAAKFLLKNKGKFFTVLPIYRFVEALETFEKNKLFLKRIRFIHPTNSEPATNVLLEVQKGVKKGGEIIEPPVFIYEDPKVKKYTPYVENLLENFAEK